MKEVYDEGVFEKEEENIEYGGKHEAEIKSICVDCDGPNVLTKADPENSLRTDHLDERTNEKLMDVIYEFPEVFAKNANDWGETDVVIGHAYSMSELPADDVGSTDHTEGDLEYVAGIKQTSEVEQIRWWYEGKERLPSYLAQLKHQFVSFDDGRLMVNHKEYIPTHELRKKVMEVHQSPSAAGHMECEKTIEQFRRQYFGVGITAITREVCRTCDVCQRKKPFNYTPKAKTERQDRLRPTCGVSAASLCLNRIRQVDIERRYDAKRERRKRT